MALNETANFFNCNDFSVNLDIFGLAFILNISGPITYYFYVWNNEKCSLGLYIKQELTMCYKATIVNTY